jgi:hypothetical protein
MRNPYFTFVALALVATCGYAEAQVAVVFDDPDTPEIEVRIADGDEAGPCSDPNVLLCPGDQDFRLGVIGFDFEAGFAAATGTAASDPFVGSASEPKLLSAVTSLPRG